ncbi:hypothetical protein D5R93_05760 [Actinomyces lilanjuaniae]|uniref:tRNA nuclease CdiA C-terminal domain-containing protein n=1 Tax=Actinomyces lilanjuaniae TaxID=2321394 RepID=A0ABM6Z3A4_9ACTO|nr:hypothetical protein [Actinomyces lilanjuaniae]AYD89677.1 hypothetical protein D5R93_05760 [Actinomyces lilanjuaniae]
MVALDPWEALRFSTSELSARAVQALLTAFETRPLMTRTELAHLIQALQAEYGRAASAATVDTLTTTRAAAGRLDLPAPQMVDVIGLAQSSGVAGYALAGSDPARRAAVSVDRLVRGAQRQTVYESTARAGTAFARVPRPGACAFCLMLASRGAVYARDTAVRATSASRARAGQSYHDSCHCQAREVLSPADVPPVVAGLHEQWQRLAAQSPSGVVTLGQWRDHVRSTRAADAAARRTTTTSASVPSAADSAQGTSGTGQSRVGKAERTTRRRGGADEAQWAARQAALASDTSGEALFPHEIEFLESMEVLGERVQWISRAPYVPGRGRLPTNDFVWVTNGGITTELKATTTSYKSIRQRIQPAVRKAAEQGVVKDAFVIDIGPYRLTPRLRAQLEQYNIRQPDSAVARLWVMGAGELTEIHLRAR